MPLETWKLLQPAHQLVCGFKTTCHPVLFRGGDSLPTLAEVSSRREPEAYREGREGGATPLQLLIQNLMFAISFQLQLDPSAELYVTPC